MKLPRLLVDAPSGNQEIWEVQPHTVCTIPVMWDERIHGPMPAGVQLGGMEAEDIGGIRVLKVNQAKLEAQRAAKQAKADAKAARDAARAAAKSRIGAIDWAKVSTVAELKQIVRDLVDKDLVE